MGCFGSKPAFEDMPSIQITRPTYTLSSAPTPRTHQNATATQSHIATTAARTFPSISIDEAVAPPSSIATPSGPRDPGSSALQSSALPPRVVEANPLVPQPSGPPSRAHSQAAYLQVQSPQNYLRTFPDPRAASSQTGVADIPLDAATILTLPEAPDLTNRLKKLGSKAKKHGGFSDVWEGELKPDRQRVAIKILRAVGVGNARPDSEGVQIRLDMRLKREMRIWMPLNHPRIVPCLGFAMVDGMPSLVSPWYHNGNANEYITANPGCNRKALIAQVAEGLVYLHGLKNVVVHYDVKSPNVLITDAGEAAITDFGIAKIISEARTGLTTSNTNNLSIRSASPEAMDGQNRSVESDVYSFGCFALEIMTGHAPYYNLKTPLSILSAKSRGVTPNPRDFPLLPEHDPLWNLLRKCWDHDPLKRPTMTEVLAELKSLGYHP